MTTPMDDLEKAELCEYAVKFGYAVGNQHPWLRDDLVGAAGLGLAIALASEKLPETPDERRKFVGQAIWNLIRQELKKYIKPGPIPLADLGIDRIPDIEQVPEHVARVDWLDEFETIASELSGRASDVFRLAFGDQGYTRQEIKQQLGISSSCVHYNIKKIRRTVRRRYKEQDSELG